MIHQKILWRRVRDSNPRTRSLQLPAFQAGAFSRSANSPQSLQISHYLDNIVIVKKYEGLNAILSSVSPVIPYPTQNPVYSKGENNNCLKCSVFLLTVPQTEFSFTITNHISILINLLDFEPVKFFFPTIIRNCKREWNFFVSICG